MTIKLCQLLLMVRDFIQSLLNYALSKVFPAILRLSNREIDVWKIPRWMQEEGAAYVLYVVVYGWISAANNR